MSANLSTKVASWPSCSRRCALWPRLHAPLERQTLRGEKFSFHFLLRKSSGFSHKPPAPPHMSSSWSCAHAHSCRLRCRFGHHGDSPMSTVARRVTPDIGSPSCARLRFLSLSLQARPQGGRRRPRREGSQQCRGIVARRHSSPPMDWRAHIFSSASSSAQERERRPARNKLPALNQAHDWNSRSLSAILCSLVNNNARSKQPYFA